VLAGGGFAIYKLTNKSSTSSSPAANQGSVKTAFDALSSGDEGRIADVLVPRESSLIKNNIDDFRQALRKMPNSPYKNMVGDVLELKTTTLESTVALTTGDVSYVTITRLEATATNKVGQLDSGTISINGTTVTTTSKKDGTKTQNLKQPIEVVVVGGKVSLLYTAIDNALLESSGQRLTLGPNQAKGSSSPEQAVQDFAAALTSKDFAQIAGVLDPYEGRLLTGNALQALRSQSKAGNIEAQIQSVNAQFNLQTTSQSLPGDRAVVTIQGTVAAGGQTINIDDAAQGLKSKGLPGVFLVTVKDGSGWHVSLLETVTRYGLNFLQSQTG
jgi:hypothetical protein